MTQIILPEILTRPLPHGYGIEAPQDMPFIELVFHLYHAGYKLKATTDGNLTAVPIRIPS